MRQSGFSLVEVIVALGVLTVGIASAIALFAAATAAHKRAINQTNAAAIAEQAIADIESALASGATPDQIAADPPFLSLRRDYPAYDIEASILVPTAEDQGDQLVVEIVVRWTARGQVRADRFRQVVTREASIR